MFWVIFVAIILARDMSLYISLEGLNDQKRSLEKRAVKWQCKWIRKEVQLSEIAIQLSNIPQLRVQVVTRPSAMITFFFAVSRDALVDSKYKIESCHVCMTILFLSKKIAIESESRWQVVHNLVISRYRLLSLYEIWPRVIYFRLYIDFTRGATKF